MFPRSWYRPYMMPDGTMIYGAAALNRRIADKGGMDVWMSKHYRKQLSTSHTKKASNDSTIVRRKIKKVG